LPITSADGPNPPHRLRPTLGVERAQVELRGPEAVILDVAAVRQEAHAAGHVRAAPHVHGHRLERLESVDDGAVQRRADALLQVLPVDRDLEAELARVPDPRVLVVLTVADDAPVALGDPALMLALRRARAVVEPKPLFRLPELGKDGVVHPRERRVILVAEASNGEC
jgi:hypothetical protein